MNSKFDQVFIVTYGRSGSTLLQRVINSIDGYMVKGENNGALLHLFRSVRVLADGQRKVRSGHSNEPLPPSTSEAHPWFGIHSIDCTEYAGALAQAFVEHIIAPDKSIRVYGFKEIRYIDLPQQLSEFLNFMLTSFSNPAFVFNYRRHDDVVYSRWWKRRDPDELRAKLSRFEATASQFADEHEERCIELRYEDYTADFTVLKVLFDFLGENFNQSEIERIMRERLVH